MGSVGVFYGFGLWEMKFLNILVLAIKKKRCKILWVPIMPKTQMLWVRDFFFLTFHNFLLGSFFWEDACQQHTVQLIMGSRG